MQLFRCIILTSQYWSQNTDLLLLFLKSQDVNNFEKYYLLFAKHLINFTF